MTDAQFLAAINTALFLLLTKGAQEYTIAGRSFTALDVGKLQELKVIYEGRVAAAAGGGIGGGTVEAVGGWPGRWGGGGW